MSEPLTKAQRDARRRKAEKAFTLLLEALGVEKNSDLRGTAARAAALWADNLLRGEHADLAKIVGTGMVRQRAAPVLVTDIGMHLVCPHHLTVAFGHAQVAYMPGGRVAGFGTLSEVVQACTARFTLQEDATQAVCDALVEHLEAAAAVTLIEAVHPCHNVTHPRSHRSRVVTLAHAGKPRAVAQLQRLIKPTTPRDS